MAGAAIAGDFGLRASYFWTIPFTLLAIVALIAFREPTLHRAEHSTPIIDHISATFRATLHRGSLFGMLLILVIGAVLTETIAEFNQLWLIVLHTPIALFGFFSAVLLGTIGLAGFIAPRLRLDNRKFVVFFTSILVMCGLITTINTVDWLIVLAQSIISIGLMSVGIIYLEQLHNRLPSGVRSGAASAINSLGRILFIGMALGFGVLTSHASVFAAGWLITIPLVAISVFLIYESNQVKRA